ncbi:hypothetical protein MRX96_002403 [Rhipicephalus microplus]
MRPIIKPALPVPIAIAILVSKAASVFTEGGVHQTSLEDIVEMLTPTKVNVVVVSFDEHWRDIDNSLMRHLPWPTTTWIFKKGELLRYVFENGAGDRLTVAIIPSLSVHWRDIVDEVKVIFEHTFVRWIVTGNNLTLSHTMTPAWVLPSCTVGTSQRSHINLGVANVDTLVYDYRPQEELRVLIRSTKKTSLKGKAMKIGCVRYKQSVVRYSCSLYSYLFDMLSIGNVSLEYKLTSAWLETMEDLYCESIDMAVLLMPSNEDLLAMATYDEIHMVPETFYALESKTQATSLYYNTFQSAFTVAVTAASLMICAGLLVFISCSHIRERVQSETLFLLALVFARSSPFPKATRWPRAQNVVYLFWAVAMLPLSQYFQSELTAQVTLGRPASSLDTLEELEVALDNGAVTPCVTNESASLTNLRDFNHSTTLGKKLRQLLLKYPDRLLKESPYSCFDCATKADHVCYSPRIPTSMLKRLSDDIIAFDENFIALPSTLPIRKAFPLKEAFRALLQRVREGGLLSSHQCRGEMICKRFSSTQITSETQAPLFELHGFFAFYAGLTSCTVGAFIAEIVFARFSKHPSFRSRRWCWQSVGNTHSPPKWRKALLPQP